MSTRALRKLQAEKQGPVEVASESEEDEVPLAMAKKKKNKKKKNVPANPFELLDDEQDEVISDEGEEVPGVHTTQTETISPVAMATETMASVEDQGVKKKKKKKKKKKAANVENPAKDDLDEVEASVNEVNRILGELPQPAGAQIEGHPLGSDVHTSSNMRALLTVEHRNLNPDTEMRRIFGSRVVQANQGNPRRQQRNRAYRRNTWLSHPKDTWPQFGKTGLHMELHVSRDGCHYFTFEHNKSYQQIQFQFLDAVESLDPQNIINLLHIYPFHIDSLLQVSEICRMSDDTAMATDMIERALYVYECCFHPVFSITKGNSRLEFRRPENRAFYLALYRHLVYVGQRGCNRTALEFCKLLLSLDPDGDPLAVLLLIDFYALRSEQYAFLIRMYQEWEAHRNLSQLPNFAFSVPLAMFHQNTLDGTDLSAADDLLQVALLQFPALLIQLLDHCTVAPDKEVAAHAYFGTAAQLSQPAALQQLVALYVGRCDVCWREPDVMTWLERNVRRVMQRVDGGDPLVEEYSRRRQTRYQGSPRNISRHVILSEIKGALAALPPEVSSAPVLSYDPLPPRDSITSYTRPQRPRRVEQSASPLSMFFQSLLPNFNPQEAVAEPAGAAAGAEGGDLRQGIVTLMDSMRNLLNNIRPTAPPIEHGGVAQEEADENSDSEGMDA